MIIVRQIALALRHRASDMAARQQHARSGEAMSGSRVESSCQQDKVKRSLLLDLVQRGEEGAGRCEQCIFADEHDHTNTPTYLLQR